MKVLEKNLIAKFNSFFTLYSGAIILVLTISFAKINIIFF